MAVVDMDYEENTDSAVIPEQKARGRQLPPRVRLLGGLFAALLVCDFLVAGLVLGWPDRIIPWIVDGVIWARSRAAAAPVALSAPPVPTALASAPAGPGADAALVESPQEHGKALAMQLFSPSAATPTPLSTAQKILSAGPSATPFIPQTYTPTVTQTATPLPTATEIPPAPPASPEEQPLPDSALVEGVSGVTQSLPLSCESRSAVDYARFFGVEIGELEFQYALPFSDDPDTGFVGDPRGMVGIPPSNYGVYAGPVATLLRAYGVAATDRRWLSYDELQREIAAGRPVIVWVIGAVYDGGSPQQYTASNGHTTTVAFNEHTVMIVGYDPRVVVVQDGGKRFEVPVERFMRSWSVLEYMAVLSE